VFRSTDPFPPPGGRALDHLEITLWGKQSWAASITSAKGKCAASPAGLPARRYQRLSNQTGLTVILSTVTQARFWLVDAVCGPEP
jgi:hypothetical protein